MTEAHHAATPQVFISSTAEDLAPYRDAFKEALRGVFDPSAPHGWRYGPAETLAPLSTVSPRSLPGAHMPVAALLP